jgi:hypothetical protein
MFSDLFIGVKFVRWIYICTLKDVYFSKLWVRLQRAEKEFKGQYGILLNIGLYCNLLELFNFNIIKGLDFIGG